MKLVEETTIAALIQKLEAMDLPGDVIVRVSIETRETEKPKRKLALPFLDHEDYWDDPDTPSDLSARVDDYLYDER